MKYKNEKKADEKKSKKVEKITENKSIKETDKKKKAKEKEVSSNKSEMQKDKNTTDKKPIKNTKINTKKEVVSPKKINEDDENQNEDQKKQKQKEKLVKNEIKRLDSNLKQIPPKKKLIAKGLIEEAAYMKATMKELKEEIDKKGPIDIMQQGNYSIVREHPALKAYNTTVQRYSTVIKLLTDLIPKEMPKEESDGFDEFVGNRDD